MIVDEKPSLRHSVAFWGAYVLLACMMVYLVAPVLETRFFPVYSKFQIVTAVQHPDGVLATFKFTKYRECEARGLTWYLGEIGPSTSVNAKAPASNRLPRPLGTNQSSPYLLADIALDDLKTRLIAQLRNQCYFSFFGYRLFPQPWLTVSEVYP